MAFVPRRDFVSALGAASVWPLLVSGTYAGSHDTANLGKRGPHETEKPRATPGGARRFRVRTLTAGVTLRDAADLRPVDSAIAFLERAKKRFEGEGYEVQTLRIATQPFLGLAGIASRRKALEPLQLLDRSVTERRVLLSLGPVLATDRLDPDLAAWAAEVVRTTRSLNMSVSVASAAQGVHLRAARVAAETILAIARALPGGIGNFRFAAAANVEPGTPFFPVAVHQGPDALAIGLELGGFIGDVFEDAARMSEVAARARVILDDELREVQRIGEASAADESRAYLGIDPSPAPSKDRSIGRSIERIAGTPFGTASTLRACALITDVLKTLATRRCGYAGLMLPVLEDPVLAQRAGEGRYGLRDLLLFSSVCGTGLDVVPIPGDVPRDTLAAVIADVAALSVKLRKPLSARLLPVPGKRAGQAAHFDDPLLTDCVVFGVD